MDSETTHFLPLPESLPSLWISDSCSSMEGEFSQPQAKADRNRGGKKRRLTLDQVRMLERTFNAESKLEHERKVQIAEEIGLRPRQVAVWFQNRRARSKTKKIEIDYESLNAEYDKLKNDFDSLLKVNHELKAEVDQLRDKWAATEKTNNPYEPVGALYKVEMGSSRQEQGSRSSSKSDVFYAESPTRENQSRSGNFLRDEEEDDELGYWGILEDELSADELMDSFNVMSSAAEYQSFCFWSF